MSRTFRDLSDPEEERANRYSYHSPSEAGVVKHARLSVLFIELEGEIASLVPAGREFSIVKTKLEEAKMWASAGVARNPDTC